MGLLYSFISPDNGISSFTGENKNLACLGLSIAAVIVVVVVVAVVITGFGCQLMRLIMKEPVHNENRFSQCQREIDVIV